MFPPHPPHPLGKVLTQQELVLALQQAPMSPSHMLVSCLHVGPSHMHVSCLHVSPGHMHVMLSCKP